MQQLEGERPNIVPNFTISSSGEVERRNDTENKENEIRNAEEEKKSSGVTKKRAKRKSDILLWLESYEERKKEREEEMMRRREAMHQKTLNMMDRLIEKL